MEKKDVGRGFEDALRIFLDSFLEVHPKKTWPSWFKTCTTYGGQREADHRWRFSFSAVPRSVLGPGDSWEADKNGGYVLARTDMETGEKRYVISNAPSDVITIFEAIVDIAMKTVLIVSDRDLGTINGDDLLPLQR
ncbi:hypothetical protein [Massilia genomosp. 1]|uniref:Uncharacterized protein n=1 Tax=Massilia genomosp. 1 TaxID=2609280 RepID=A0ABX0N3Y8_9BURK|nr:hypothetical protein [Massilia genomosp. 1]NHZ67113.1 hypothetical protein [Massilia genomosp. 1]